MDKHVLRKLMAIAFTALGVAGLIFLCLAIFGYEKAWTLPAALGCNTLALLYWSVFRQGKDPA